ncbi:hypothetical protein PMZ80_002725 [Knufia obscura]|uniref:amidase n=1 Tax=Knufia obscura TaxID=1635080 RepID=A0ABR0RY59_9EURO|nr:hypothetical protein PMZ80_002725 [Knufia obscura]
MSNSGWQEIATKKQAERDALLPSKWRLDMSKYQSRNNLLTVPIDCGILSDKQIDITSNYDAVDLIARMRDGTFSVEEVVTAFCARAAIAQQLTNCLTEIFFDEAIERARQLDHEKATNPDKPLPKLFGLPISLKDSFMVPGTDATIGFICFANDKSTKYSVLCEMLLEQGAVFYCKTAIPQTLMTADSDNNVFGRCLNPHNTSLTAGGSSGGEGALIAMRGSVVGIGTDIAGSIRIPAHCNGTYGFKPSARVVSLQGKRSPGRAGLVGVEPVAGPLATSARANALIMQVILEAELWKRDSMLNHIFWRGLTLPNRPLKIGVVEDDGQNTPTPPMRRMMRDVSQKLMNAGVELIPLKLTEVDKAMDLLWFSFSMDGMKVSPLSLCIVYDIHPSQDTVDYINQSGEPMVNSVRQTGLVALPAKSIHEILDFTVARIGTQEKYRDMWLSNGLDALIMPPAPFTAPKIDTWGGLAAYTALWNLMDYPAAIVPIGQVNPDDRVDEAAKYGAKDAKVYNRYSGPEQFADAPTTIQVVGMKQEDEYLALVVEKLDAILKSR